MTGLTALPSDITTWDIFDHLRFPSIHDFEGLLRSRAKQPGFCASLKVCPGAKEGFEKIKKRNVVIHIVTSPYFGNPTWHSDRERWLEKHFGIHHSQVTHSQKKHNVHGDLFVDDKPSHVQEWGDRWSRTSAFLWNTPHNQESKLPRLSNWDELDEILEARGL